MDSETRARFDTVEAQIAALDKRVQLMDAETKSRFDQSEERFGRAMAAIAEQFEVMQKYMDRRFNEVLEALDFRIGGHERRIRRLEDRVFGE